MDMNRKPTALLPFMLSSASQLTVVTLKYVNIYIQSFPNHIVLSFYQLALIHFSNICFTT